MKKMILFQCLSSSFLFGCGSSLEAAKHMTYPVAANQISNAISSGGMSNTIDPIPMLIQLKVISQNPETNGASPIAGNWDRLWTKCQDGFNTALPFTDGSLSISNDSSKFILVHKNGMTAAIPATFSFPSYGTGILSVSNCGLILVNSHGPYTPPTIKATRFTYLRSGTQLQVKFDSDVFCNKNSNGVPGPGEAVFTQVH